MLRPSSGAQASTVHRPSPARVGRISGSHRVCRTPVRFSPFTNSRNRPNWRSAEHADDQVRLAAVTVRILLKPLHAREIHTRRRRGRRPRAPTCRRYPRCAAASAARPRRDAVDQLRAPARRYRCRSPRTAPAAACRAVRRRCWSSAPGGSSGSSPVAALDVDADASTRDAKSVTVYDSGPRCA